MDKDYVTFKKFTWIIGVLITIVVGINGVVWSELKEVKGELVGYKDSTYEKISSLQKETTEIKGDVKWLVTLFKNYEIDIE